VQQQNTSKFWDYSDTKSELEIQYRKAPEAFSIINFGIWIGGL
jgi:isopentenyl diphosphate isomerase/L-lactate dehydrogenase-like FMN-dependent dehydrogenase